MVVEQVEWRVTNDLGVDVERNMKNDTSEDILSGHMSDEQ